MESYIKEFKDDHKKESEVVVTVDGPSGAGKGTIADHISSKMRINHFSASDVFYSIAEDEGISHVELAKRADKNVDLEVDRRTLERGLKLDCVIDSRIASWVLGSYSDLRIRLTASVEERAKRIAARDNQPYKQTLKETKERDKENSRRYKEYYGIDTDSRDIYDVCIDNTSMPIEDQKQKINQKLRDTFPDTYNN